MTHRKCKSNQIPMLIRRGRPEGRPPSQASSPGGLLAILACLDHRRSGTCDRDLDRNVFASDGATSDLCRLSHGITPIGFRADEPPSPKQHHVAPPVSGTHCVSSSGAMRISRFADWANEQIGITRSFHGRLVGLLPFALGTKDAFSNQSSEPLIYQSSRDFAPTCPKQSSSYKIMQHLVGL